MLLLYGFARKQATITELAARSLHDWKVVSLNLCRVQFWLTVRKQLHFGCYACMMNSAWFMGYIPMVRGVPTNRVKLTFQSTISFSLWISIVYHFNKRLCKVKSFFTCGSDELVNSTWLDLFPYLLFQFVFKSLFTLVNKGLPSMELW